MILTAASVIFVFGLLVLAHEFGHFITAKFTGMRVDEFAIGFGPKLFKVRRGETVYSIRAIPLGGFNDIAGMDPSDNPAGDRGFCEKPVFSRMIVVLAGSTMNFVLPIILFFGIFATVGTPQPATEPVIGVVLEGPAEKAGLVSGDRVLKVDGKPIETWDEFTKNLQVVEAGQPVQIQFARDEKVETVSVVPEFNEKANRALIGVQSAIVYTPMSVPDAFLTAVARTGEILRFMVDTLIDLFKSPSDAELTGPVGIAKITGQVAESGFIPLLNFAALLSLNLGIMNLLPVPALDGGHFVNLTIEAVRGKPLGAKTLMYVQRAGIALLLILTIAVTTNDVWKIFFK